MEKVALQLELELSKAEGEVESIIQNINSSRDALSYPRSGNLETIESQRLVRRQLLR
jgi:hypothetical protein